MLKKVFSRPVRPSGWTMSNPSKRFQAQSSTRDLLLNSAMRATARSPAPISNSSYVLYPTGSHFAGRSVRIFCRNAVFLHVYNPVSLRSEEHTSELQSLRHLVCRLL